MALYIRGSKRALAKSVPFLYCWTHNATGKWYVGSRTAPVVRSWAKNNKNGWTFQLKEVA
jgi:hypothetical protein